MLTFHKTFRNNPLAAKLTFLIILASSVITVIAIGLTLYKQYRDDITALDDRLASIEVISLSSLSKSLWKFDDEQVHIIINSILALEDVIFVEVNARNWDGSIRSLHVGQPPAGDDLSYRTLTFPLLSESSAAATDNNQLGNLVVTASLESVYQRLIEQAGFIIGTQAIKTLIITAVILWLLKRLLTDHLARISQFSRSIKLVDPMPELELERARGSGDRQDELDNVVQAINTMTHDLVRQQRNELSLLRERVKAESANHAKSEFIATMSHEIRTPMNGIIGMLDLFDTDNLNDNQRDQLSIVRQSSETLLMIINDILDFSRIEAGKLELNHEDFELDGLVSDCAQLYSSTAQEKHLEFEVIIDPDTPNHFIGDSIRLRQILMNLLGNAFKFTDSGHIRVVVRPDNVSENTPLRIRFEIHDSGCGIAKSELDKLFLPFEQSQSGKRQGSSGTGLGLAICQRLVALMHGDIGVNSELGKGATFWFSLPLELSTQAHEAEQRRLAKCREHLQGKLFVIVDDDPNFARRMQHLCEDLHLNTLHFGSLREARTGILEAAANGQTISGFFIDINLPDGNGYQLCQWLRQQAEYRQTFITIVTALANAMQRRNLEDFGANASLVKPVTPGQLQKIALQATGVQAADNPATEVQRYPDLRVLVAEDNATNCLVIKAMLAKFGIEPTLCHTGQEAYELVSRGHANFDLILMDCEMPDLDGYESTKLIRYWEQKHLQPRLPVIALTAHYTITHRERAFEAGMDAYISKPVKLQELADTLQRYSEVSQDERATS